MAQVVVAQPNQGQKGQELGMQMPAMGGPPPNMPVGLPPGLGYLAQLDEIRIHQQFEAVEVFLNFERNNKYSICNNGEQQFLFAKEDTDCLTRQCCGVARPFQMFITDNQGQAVIGLDRPFRCQGSLLWCCYLQEMDIQSPPGMSIGKIKEVWSAFIPKYVIEDTSGRTVFRIVGDCCYCKCCTDVMFKVFDGESENEIGQIIKHWSGCREIFGGANDFSIKFPSNMDVMRKTLLLGAVFLVDFNYFEINRNSN